MESDRCSGFVVGVDSRTSEALVVSGDGLFRYRTVRRVFLEESFNQKWLDEAVTPTDECVQKGAKTSFEDVRVLRHVVEGHAPVQAAPARAFVPRRARLSKVDFERFGYTENCRGCEFLQAGIAEGQNHSGQC